MSHYNTGIENIPSLFDLSSALAGFVTDFAQVVLGSAQTSFKAAALEDDSPGRYDPTARSWEGTGGLRYHVPLFPIPSERHTREKTRNIKILMDNCRRICVDDELPSTKEEMQFWTAYRFMKYQLYLAPTCIIMPPLYVMWRMFHDRIPRLMRGRTIPITLSLALAEQWAEATYPGHQLLSTALKAKTPLGDAARAEWVRLQPIDIPFYIYTAYQFQHFLGNAPKELQFGGDVVSLCRTMDNHQRRENNAYGVKCEENDRVSREWKLSWESKVVFCLIGLNFFLLFTTWLYYHTSTPVVGPGDLSEWSCQQTNDCLSMDAVTALKAPFWLSGSWGRIARAPDGCTVHPRFESFAFSCPNGMNKSRLVVEIELMPLFNLYSVKCLTCSFVSSKNVSAHMQYMSRRNEGKSSSNAAAEVFEVSLPEPSISCQVYQPHETDKWGFHMNGLRPSTCLVRFDILASMNNDLNGAASVPPICFAAVGDWGEPSRGQKLVIEQLKRVLQQYWVKFIALAGDNFYPVGVRSSSDQAWVDTFEIPFSDKVFHRVPFLISVGNHDVAGNISAQVQYGVQNARWYFPDSFFGANIPLIQRYEGETNWSMNAFVDERGKGNGTRQSSSSSFRNAELLDFFVMSSYEVKKFGNQVRNGYEFFNSARNRNQRQHRWKLVLNHEALLAGGFHGLSKANQLLRKRMLRFLADNKVHVYLNGDDHILEVHRFNGTDIITSGGGGGGSIQYSMLRLPTTVWRLENADKNKKVRKRTLGFTLHCTVPFTDVLRSTLLSVNEDNLEVLYKHTTHYNRGV